MRTIPIYTIIYLIAFFANGQENAGKYMSDLGGNYNQINKDTWDYIKQAAKGKNAAKVERRRVELANTLKSAKYQASQSPSFNGDKSLKDAYIQYLGLSYLSINEDYKKIVDMERIAEESYNDMEAYLLAKERVSKKMDSAFSVLKAAQNAFANKYNVNLISSESRISKKLNNASEVNKYDNQIFLLFFKSNWYEGKMIEAQNQGKIGDIEQYRQGLEITSKEGMESLKQINSYEGDKSLKDACFSILEFYYGEAVRYMPKQIEFYESKDRMEVAQKNYESKNRKSLTQKDVDQFNKAIDAYNQSLNTFNETNEYLNKYRSKRLNNFNKTRQTFFDKYL